MFELNGKVINRGWYKFVATLTDGKFIYETTDKKEIEVLEWLKFVKKAKK